MSHSDVLSSDDFNMLFDPRAGMMANTLPKPSATKLQNKIKEKEGHNEEYASLLKYFAECLKKDDTRPSRFF